MACFTRMLARVVPVIVAAGLFVHTADAQRSVTKAAREVNTKMVKLFGGGGFKGLPSYGTGILVSDDGYILTVNNHILVTTNLRVHLYDGRFHYAKLIAREPGLDVALLKIDGEVANLPHYDIEKMAKRKLAETGDWILALSNQFQIATRDEPMSVQRGVISAYTELRGRRGVFAAPYRGKVYFLDVVACNPGSAGGIITDRRGNLLGILGRELKNKLTDTWVNYAVPIQASVDIQRDGKPVTIDLARFVKEAKTGKYQQGERQASVDKGGYHGLVLVPNVVSATPPYVDDIARNSPADKAGFRPDDLITYIDGEFVTTISLFREIMKGYGPGDKVRIEVQRDNELKSLTISLGEHPNKKKKTAAAK